MSKALHTLEQAFAMGIAVAEQVYCFVLLPVLLA